MSLIGYLDLPSYNVQNDLSLLYEIFSGVLLAVLN
jgi:hypothetical protein